MADRPQHDAYGSTETQTAYDAKERPGSSRGLALSAWAIIAAAIFLVLCVLGLVLAPEAPSESPAIGSAAQLPPSRDAGHN